MNTTHDDELLALAYATGVTKPRTPLVGRTELAWLGKGILATAVCFTAYILPLGLLDYLAG